MTRETLDPRRVRAQRREWVSLNTAPLLEFWAGVNIVQFAYRLKPLDPMMSLIPSRNATLVFRTVMPSK